jgi:SAM-dependent methyltransferase
MGSLRAMDAKPWYEATDGRLPSWFASTATDVSTQVSDSEAMPAADLAGYLAVGESALKAIRLAQLAARVPDFQAILDLPCGHGRVLRWLRAAYPGASLTACDILADGVEFCRDAFGAKPVYSHRRIEASAFPESYDLIWVGSLFTHVDVPDWDHLLSLFDRLLRPDGVLVITTHGELVAERMRATTASRWLGRSGYWGGQPAAPTCRSPSTGRRFGPTTRTSSPWSSGRATRRSRTVPTRNGPVGSPVPSMPRSAKVQIGWNPKPRLECRRRPLLLAVRGDQRGVVVDDQRPVRVDAPRTRIAADAVSCRFLAGKHESNRTRGPVERCCYGERPFALAFCPGFARHHGNATQWRLAIVQDA